MHLNKPIIFETTFTRYTCSEIIGEGGAGYIYRAVDDEGNVRAIKLLAYRCDSDEKVRRTI